MAKVGVLIEIENGEVKETDLGVLTAACKGGGNEVFAIAMQENTDTAASVLAEYGVNQIVQVVTKGGNINGSPDFEARVLAEAVKNFELNTLLGLASAKGRDLFARLAAFMDVPLVSDCISIDLDAKTVRKSHFSGKTVATLKVESELMLCTIRPNAIEAQTMSVQTQTVVFEAQAADPGLTKITDIKQSAGGKVDLTEAGIIITGGRPIDSADNYKMLDECAAQLGESTAVGASRAAVDAGFAPHSMQVGQTGKTVSPKLYIGCGLSGSVQHFAGMKTSKVIVAINTDKDAPIFNKCDYGIIADMYEVVPMLTQVLKEQSD